MKNSKGNNSAKNAGGVTVVNLCMSSDHALHLCQVSRKYLERYQSYGADTNDQPLTEGPTDGQTDGQTDTQKFGGYNIIPHHFLWRGIKIIVVSCLSAVQAGFYSNVVMCLLLDQKVFCFDPLPGNLILLAVCETHHYLISKTAD